MDALPFNGYKTYINVILLFLAAVALQQEWISPKNFAMIVTMLGAATAASLKHAVGKKVVSIMPIFLALFLAAPVFAGSVSSDTGAGNRWRKVDGEWNAVFKPLIGASYHVVASDDGGYGWTFGWKSSAGEEDNESVNRYIVGNWWVKGAMEPFIDLHLETWGDGITGDNEFLFGGGAGVRFDAGGVPMEFSGYYDGGSGVADAGIQLSLHLTEDFGDDEE